MPPCAAASLTAPTSAERNGSTRLPSLDVPSANSTTDVPEAKPRDDFLHRVGGLVAARAVDEHRALHARRDADQRPAGDLALGDKGDGRKRADHHDVGPGHMVRHIEHGAAAHRRADDAHADAQDRAQHAVIVGRDEAPAGQTELAEQPLQRDQDRRHGEEEHRDQERADHKCFFLRMIFSENRFPLFGIMR